MRLYGVSMGLSQGVYGAYIRIMYGSDRVKQGIHGLFLGLYDGLI